MNMKHEIEGIEKCRICDGKIRIVADKNGRLIKCDLDQVRILSTETGQWLSGFVHHSKSCKARKVENGSS